MYRLAKHVIGLGYRNIAVISDVTDGNDRAAQRLQGIGYQKLALKHIKPPRGATPALRLV